jgi:SAM-dependent methyltransferase
MKIDIACGQNKTPGFFGIDIAPCEGVDKVMDLEKFPWDIESDSVDEVVCNHYFEHTANPMEFMNELYRIMKPGAQAKIVTPYYTSIRCWQDPTHKNAISEATYYYYNKGWRDANKLDHYPITCDFDIQFGHSINANWRSRSQASLQFAMTHYWNVIDDIHAILTKK